MKTQKSNQTKLNFISTPKSEFTHLHYTSHWALANCKCDTICPETLNPDEGKFKETLNRENKKLHTEPQWKNCSFSNGQTSLVQTHQLVNNSLLRMFVF